MKHLRKVLALISNPIIYLKDYLTMSDADKGKELIERYQWLFFEWLEEKYAIRDDLSAEENLPEELLGLYEARELYPDDIENLSNSLSEEFLQSNLVYKAISGEADAPSFLYMDFIDIVKNQWLIHFTDDAFGIAANGFTMGVSELQQLGLTTHFTDEAKKYGGYNFAFDTSDFMKYAPGSYGTWKYGKEAVVFRASGIKVFHHGDQEPQIIFFGETANSIVPIYENSDGLWIVGQRPSGEPVFRSEELENVVDWVEANYNQFKRVLAQSVEELPPQQGYPEFNPDLYQVVPEPIGYVYHVSPYAKEIMEQGFIVDPTKTTLGAFGELNSISTTNYENAEIYKQGIKIVVGVANGEINTEELINALGPKAKEAVVYVIEEEFLNFWNANFDIYELHKKLREQDPKADFLDARKIIDKAKAEILPPTYNEDQKFREFTRSPDGKDWLWSICINDLDFEGNELSEEEAKKRRWKLLKSGSLISNLPLVVGYDIPEHLKTREMHDVGIVEVAVAPTEYTQHDPHTIEYQLENIERHKQFMEENSEEYPEYTSEYINDWYQKQMEEVQDPKGKYTYSKGEQEWKFYDVTDLWPVRIVGMNHLKQAIKRLALTINKEDLATLWYENEDGEKYFPDLEKGEGLPDDVPEGFDYMYSRFPTELTTNVLQINPDGTSTEIMQGHSTWPEDLVLAMVDSGDYTLSESITIASEACSRCLNVLCHDYGLEDGYPEGSEEWKECGTECEFCKDMGHTRRENKGYLKKAIKLLGQLHPQYLYHITPTESIPEIAQGGLKTEYGGTLTSWEKSKMMHDHSRGKIFLTDPVAIENWSRYVKNNDKEPAILRVSVDSVEDIYIDELGTPDSFRLVDWEPGQMDAPLVQGVFAFYIEEDVPPNKIEVLIDNEWLPIQRYTEE